MEPLMNLTVVAEITSHFQALSSVIPLRTIRTEHDYDQAVAALNQLLDAGAANEEHPLAELANLPEIGTQGVVSEILSGKRELSVRQIKALSERFHVPPSVFV